MRKQAGLVKENRTGRKRADPILLFLWDGIKFIDQKKPRGICNGMHPRNLLSLFAGFVIPLVPLLSPAGTPDVMYELDFTTFTGTNGNPVSRNNSGMQIGGDRPVTSTTALLFSNVAVGLDVVFSVTSTQGQYSHTGLYPDYSTSSGEPTNDLGYLFTYNSGTPRLGGVTYSLEFFEAGTSTPMTVSQFSLLIYDVDGSSDQGNLVQSEAVRVFLDDGFAGYMVGKAVNGNQMTVTTEDGAHLFTGPGENVAETESSGATLLYFENTHKITLQMEANTITGTNDGVFTAIGDASLLGATEAERLSKLENFVAVPEPVAATAVLLGGGILVFGRRRRS